MPFCERTHVGPRNHVLDGASRSDKTIRSRDEWQIGDAAFRLFEYLFRFDFVQ